MFKLKRVSHIVIYTCKRYLIKQYKAVQFPIHLHRILTRITQVLAVENRYNCLLFEYQRHKQMFKREPSNVFLMFTKNNRPIYWFILIDSRLAAIILRLITKYIFDWRRFNIRHWDEWTYTQFVDANYFYDFWLFAVAHSLTSMIFDL